MPRILKIYDSGQALAQGEPQVKLIEKYPAFIVAQVADSTVEDIKRTYLAEDITDQYTLPAAGGINTSLPRINALGKTLPHPAYKSAPRLPPGPHHYIVQFIGPIKQAWLTTARKAGADFVQPYEGFSYIARMTTKGVEAVSKLPFVRWLGHLPYSARLSPDAISGASRKPDEPNPAVPRTRIRQGVYTVQFFRPQQAVKAAAEVRKLGFEILEKRSDSDFLIVQTTRTAPASVTKQLGSLSRVHGVSQITERSVPRKSNDRAARVMGTAASLGNPGLGLSGNGERSSPLPIPDWTVASLPICIRISSAASASSRVIRSRPTTASSSAIPVPTMARPTSTAAMGHTRRVRFLATVPAARICPD